MGRQLIAIAALLLVAGCASSREKAYQKALKDYQQRNRSAIAYSRVQVNQLISVTRTFHDSVNRWPKTFNELASFTIPKGLVFDPYAFNDVSFAELPDGSLQIHYDVNCSRFDTPEYKFPQTGSVNVKAKGGNR